MAGRKVHYERGLRIGTRCETVDEFIGKFCRLCDGSRIFIPQAMRPIGVDAAFSFDLKDGRAALCGIGVVLEQFADTTNPFGRAGILIEVRQLQADSQLVFEQMSTRQRMRRNDGSATTPPANESSPLSPRRSGQVPDHRPRAVTSQIDVELAVAIAEQAAAAKSGGMTTRPGLPVAVPNPIADASSKNVAREGPAPLPPAPHVEKPRVVHLPGLVPAAPVATQPAEPVVALPDPVGSDVVEHVKWDASLALHAPATAHSDVVVTPTPRRARITAAVRRMYARIQTGGRAAAERWKAATRRKRWLVGVGAGAAVVAMTIALATCGSKHPAAPPVVPAAVAAPEPAKPAVTQPAAPPPLAKKPPQKKATKRAATAKKTTKRKATSKKTSSKSSKRKRCTAQHC